MSYHLLRFSTSEVFEERQDGRELAENRGPFTSPPLQVLAPGDQGRARHDPKHFRIGNPREAHEVLEGVLIRAACLWVCDVHEPLDLRWHVGQSRHSFALKAQDRVGIKARECFLLGAMDGFGSGVGESVCSLTRTGCLWANTGLKNGSIFTGNNRHYQV